MRKTIGIITLRLLVNYGGVLQNMALQKALIKLGFNPITVRSSLPMSLDTWELTKSKGQVLKWLAVKLGLYRLMMYLGDELSLPYKISHLTGVKSWILASLGKKTLQFIHRYIKLSHYCCFPITEKDIKRIGAWAYIVGSDQVWRLQYNRDKRPFFLHFLPREVRNRSISYAASFGCNQWDWPTDMTSECKKLAKDFKAHSVREDDGVRLCEQNLGVSAKWVPDPTLLLTSDEYRDLINERGGHHIESPYVAYYILDMTQEKERFLEYVSKLMHCPLRNCTYNEDENIVVSNEEKQDVHSFRSVESWLQLIDGAKFFITDSYHGMIFALIFNTDFLCVGNNGRGSSRFASLCRRFKLHNRLVDISTLRDGSISTISSDEWARINQEIAIWREDGYKYLKNNLLETPNE